jgi:hypothetical protein
LVFSTGDPFRLRHVELLVSPKEEGRGRGLMGKFFAIVLVIIAVASAYPIVTHMFPLPEDISTHGHAIDEQLNDTMWEAGVRNFSQ